MAHFARIENGIVREVIVIKNEILLDESGGENESLGVSFCQSLFGDETQWVQTSFNAAFRGKFAGDGDLYDFENDIFTQMKFDDFA